jgi:hypothetical protein
MATTGTPGTPVSPAFSGDTLVDVRKCVIDTTGRNDLVVDTTNYADNGIDKFINRAQRFLDQRLPVWKQKTDAFVIGSVGDKQLLVQNLRWVDSVFIHNTDCGGPVKMKEGDFRELITAYNDSSTSAQPTTWAHNPIGVDPSLEGTFVPGNYEDSDFMVADSYQKNGIILNTAILTETTFQIFGVFWSPKLVGDSDKSLWTVQHSHLLALATMYMLSVYYNDHRAAREYFREIDREVFELDKDDVQLEMPHGPIALGG